MCLPIAGDRDVEGPARVSAKLPNAGVGFCVARHCEEAAQATAEARVCDFVSRVWGRFRVGRGRITRGERCNRVLSCGLQT